MAEEMGVELLGSVPLDPRIGKSADFGLSFLDEYPDSPATTAYLDIIKRTCLFSIMAAHADSSTGLKEILGDA